MAVKGGHGPGRGGEEKEDQGENPEFAADPVGIEENEDQAVPEHGQVLGTQERVVDEAFGHGPERESPGAAVFFLEMQLQEEIIERDIKVTPE